MQLSYRWLNELVAPLPSAEEVAKELTLRTCEVESVTPLDAALEFLIVGEVKTVSSHPNADQLHVTEVDVGKKFLRTIVCGAPNVRQSMRVAVAMPGSKVFDETGELFEITEREIRGVRSQGMLCSPRECGLNDEHKGIAELPSKARIGTSVRSVLGVDDTVLEIDNKSITHRGDLWSHVGIARELSALFHRPLKINIPPPVRERDRVKFSVNIASPEVCSRYMGCVIEGVKVGESPKWMQDRLRACGFRPINMVVDITNLVMLEWGQPLHAFDAGRVRLNDRKEKQIIVRHAKRGETLITLDGEQRRLDPSMLVIADTSGALAIAGVMGGRESAVNEKTTSVVLESAMFDPVSIRRTSQALGLRTDAAQRFEKRLSLETAEIAFRRAVELLTTVAGGSVASSAKDAINKTARSAMKTVRRLRVTEKTVATFLGMEISIKTLLPQLAALGLSPTASKGAIHIAIPYFRPDIELQEDLIEEIARLIGYSAIPPQPMRGNFQPVAEEKDRLLERAVRTHLAALGFQETLRYSFYGERERRASGVSISNHLQIENPLNEELRYLRVSLLPNLLTCVAANQKRTPIMRLFERGRVFQGSDERTQMTLVMTGRDHREAFFELKGVVEALLKRLHFTALMHAPTAQESASDEESLLDLLSRLRWSIDRECVILFGKIASSTAQQLGVKVACVSATLFLERMSEHFRPIAPMAKSSKFPSVFLDLALVVTENVRWADLDPVLRKAGGEWLRDLELFDVYRGDPLPPEKKSMAMHLEFNHPKKTLSLLEAERLKEQLVGAAKRRFQALIR